MKNHAFTLIELLVVVLIIGILSAIALPQYQKAVEKSRATQGITMLKSVYQAAEVYYLTNGKKADKFEQLLSWYLQTRRNEIVLEEPEDNLFPPTQCQLVDWLLENISNSQGKDMLFVATHSPYVLNQFIKDSSDEFRLLVTYPDHAGRFKVKSLSQDEIMDVYGNGVDLFFNFEAYR